ncbi:MAG: indole-3-glycerol phosphate synthase TrpC [Nitrospirae bacterium]|nr:indole-3-glycerol phosphate synthase TrpC [Nitrospirota bacterium]
MIMEGLLAKIVERKREDLARVKAGLSLRELKSRLRDREPPRDFVKAISGREKRRVNLIAEIKKKSPVKGMLVDDLVVDKLARQYEEAGASAISVITEEHYFCGNPAYLGEAKKAAKIPVLRKDFLLDEYHIYEARYIGADAILLIAAILDTAQLSDFIAISSELGMAALAEVHDETELEKALRAGAEIIGINNRDLTTFNVDIKTTMRIIKEVPAEKVIVSESGINCSNDIRMLGDAGVHAVLVGESIVTSGDVVKKIKELIGE